MGKRKNFLHSYLDLEKSRFEEKFDYLIRIDKRIDKDQFYLPPMLLQPYVENCIRHGIMHKSNGKGLVEIEFNLDKDCLICIVADNGVGRDAAAAYKSSQHIHYQSKGTILTGQRIKMINKENQSDIVLNIEDVLDENNQPAGTRVTIRIPLQKSA